MLNATRASVFAAALAICAACESPTAGRAGPPATMTIVSGDSQTAVVGAELPAQLTVRVQDDRGRVVPGVSVTFVVVEGVGSVFLGVATTNADGIASERWTLGTVAGSAHAVEVRGSDTAGSPKVFATFHATALADAPAAVSLLTPPTEARWGEAMAPGPVAGLVDKYGNRSPQAGVTVTVSFDGQYGIVLSGTTSVTMDATGAARFADLVLTASGLQAGILMFAAPGLTAAKHIVEMKPGQPKSLTGVQSGAYTNQPERVGGTVTVTIKALDGGGNWVPGVDVTLAPEAGAGSIVGPATATTNDFNGDASFTWKLPTTVGTAAVIATALGVTEPVRVTAYVRQGAVTKAVVVSADTPVGVGQEAKFVVRFTDEYDNPPDFDFVVGGLEVEWTYTVGGVTTSLANSGVDAQGFSRSSLVPNTPGVTSVTASFITHSIGSASVTFLITVTP